MITALRTKLLRLPAQPTGSGAPRPVVLFVAACFGGIAILLLVALLAACSHSSLPPKTTAPVAKGGEQWSKTSADVRLGSSIVQGATTKQIYPKAEVDVSRLSGPVSSATLTVQICRVTLDKPRTCSTPVATHNYDVAKPMNACHKQGLVARGGFGSQDGTCTNLETMSFAFPVNAVRTYAVKSTLSVGKTVLVAWSKPLHVTS